MPAPSPFILLDDSQRRSGSCLLFQDPQQIISADRLEQVDEAITALEAGLAKGLYATGFFSYELGYALEPCLHQRLPEKTKTPLLWFGLFQEPQTLESEQCQDWLKAKAHPAPLTSPVEASWNLETYRQKFECVKDYIARGDVYQLNLTFKAHFKKGPHPLALYQSLRQSQPVSYGGLIFTGRDYYLSASPELFISLKDGRLETRPMKGTAPRAMTLTEDQKVQTALHEDLKSRAENLMIVDLMRNDLSRIAAPGSVAVSDLFKVETYKTLHQMTSSVKAEIRSNVSLRELLDAIYPSGSIIGAPKIRAMELIDELETSERGLYTGSMGYFAPAKDTSPQTPLSEARFNVAIRTIKMNEEGDGEIGIGSGLVQDSQASDEYQECLLKMKFLANPLPPFQLIETIAYKPQSGLILLDRHIERLAASAHYFQFACPQADIRDQLIRSAEKNDQALRIRLLLSEDGSFSITTSKLDLPRTPPIWTFAIADHPIDESSPFVYHKTTHRHFLDQTRQDMNEKHGVEEVIFLNSQGMITEGSYTNVFIERERLIYTPPIEDGLLAGTMRAELIATGKAQEASLTPDDLSKADKIYLGNSVRGLIEAQHFERFLAEPTAQAVKTA